MLFIVVFYCYLTVNKVEYIKLRFLTGQQHFLYFWGFGLYFKFANFLLKTMPNLQKSTRRDGVNIIRRHDAISPMGINVTVPWSVCLSVCLSDTFVHCARTAEDFFYRRHCPMSLPDRITIWLTSVDPFLPKFCPKLTHPLFI